MLRPSALTAADKVVATKPGVGYESRLYVSPQQAVEIGTLTIMGANSGVWNENPDSAAYAGAAFVAASIENGYNGSAQIVVSYGTATGTLKPPTYATMPDFILPAGYGCEVENAGNTAFTKPANPPTVVCNADAKGTKITFFAMPDYTGNTGNYLLVGCKVSIDYVDPSPESVAIQCGRDRSAFVKAGEIPDKTFSLTAKVPVEGDVQTRISGQRLIGLIVEKKEDQVVVMHQFFVGLFLKSSRKIGESMEPDTLSFNGRYEKMAMIVAQ